MADCIFCKIAAKEIPSTVVYDVFTMRWHATWVRVCRCKFI